MSWVPDCAAHLIGAVDCHHRGDQANCEARMTEKSLLAQTVNQSEAAMTTPPVSSLETGRPLPLAQDKQACPN